MTHALIVDDDTDSANLMAELIGMEGFTAAIAHSLHDARRQLALQEPDLLLLDLVLPDGSGMDLLRDDSALLSNTEVVLITGHASVETSVQALRMGAADYLTKPLNIKHLRGVLSRVMRPSALEAEIQTLREEVDRIGRFGPLWGRSQPMRRIQDQIAKVCGTGVTVLITGQSGTGKEVVARAIHDLSRRRKQPFLAVNCGAISRNLIESELFGHEKGSFTGADRQHIGFFEQAHGGTLFLDEVTEMPPELQVKLLRVLETGTFSRVGSTRIQEADVRVIAATNRSPEQAVAEGQLREDLLYRLNVFPIHLCPLRDRLEDIPLLAQHFLQDIARREGSNKTFAPGVLDLMQRHTWPGNVRELRNAVQRAYVMADGAVIQARDLILGTQGFEDAVLAPAGTGPASASAAAAVNGSPSGAPAPAGAAGRDDAGGPAITVRVGTALADMERDLILATLKHFNSHKEKTAAALGVSLKTLYNRLKEYSAQGYTA